MELKDRFLIFSSFLAIIVATNYGLVDSESLTIPTYYPSPYGGYSKILTTGDTMLSTVSGQLIIGASSSTSGEKLYLGKDMYITGYIRNLCTWRNMIGTGWSPCDPNEVVIGENDQVPGVELSCSGSSNDLCLSGNIRVPGQGQMLCCKLR